MNALASGRADQIYRAGPEVLVKQSSSILAGAVSSYSRQIVTSSQPPGPAAIPLTWTIAGRLEHPDALKGAAQEALSFTRNEHSVFVPDTVGREYWELGYGDLAPTDQVVVFLRGGSAPKTTMDVIPSGTGERDLVALVKDIVAIQAMEPDAQASAWLAYVERPHPDSGLQAALRSLVAMRVDWTRLGSTLDRFMANPGSGEAMRRYVFGIVAYGLQSAHWADSTPGVGASLCRWFAAERDNRTLLDYLLKLKSLLRYTSESTQAATRAPLRTALATCLRNRESELRAVPELAQQYREIHSAHADLP